MRPGIYLIAAMIFATPFWLTGNVQAGDNLQLEIVTIQGNRELPKVLYIVPWKRLKNDAANQKLVLHSLFKDVFDPLEPDSFKQQVEQRAVVNNSAVSEAGN